MLHDFLGRPALTQFYIRYDQMSRKDKSLIYKLGIIRVYNLYIKNKAINHSNCPLIKQKITNGMYW